MRKHYGERMGEIPSRMKNRAAPISRVLFPYRGGGHLSGLWVSLQLKRPTRESRGSGQAPAFAFPPYLALLRVGVASFRCYHRNWWALTPPFHPCSATGQRLCRRAVWFLWPYPYPGPLEPGPPALPGTLPSGARTFLGSVSSRGRLGTAQQI